MLSFPVFVRFQQIATLVLLVACSPRHLEVKAGPVAPTVPSLRWLGNDARMAQAAGADQATLIVAEAGAVGDRFTKVLQADASACLLIMARASERVPDVDLYVYSEDGSVLAVDDRTDARPNLLVCPPHPPHLYVTARIAVGQGVVAVGVQHVPVEKARRVRLALHMATELADVEAKDVAIPDVDGRLLAHHKALTGRWIPIAQSTLAVDYRLPTVLALPVEPGTCLDALVLTPAHLSGLDVELLDDTGRTVGRSVGADADQWLVACSEVRRNVVLQLRPHEGIGTALIVASRGELRTGRATERALELGLGQEIDQLIHRVHSEAIATHPPLERIVARTTVMRGQQQRFSAQIKTGCSRFDVFAGAPSSGVSARVYSKDGELLSSNGGAQYLPLVACARGSVTLVVEAHSKGGPLSIEQYSQKIRPVAASRYPRATARLFQKAWQLGLVRDLSEFEPLETMNLREKTDWSREVSVEAGKCADVFVSIDSDAVGVSLNWMNMQTGEAIESDQHPDTAHIRLCCAAGSSTCNYPIVAKSSGAAQKGLFAILHRR